MRATLRPLLAILSVCLVFFLGMIAGGAVTIHFVRQRAEAILWDRGAADIATENMANRLSTRLGCDKEQRAQISGIFRASHEEMHAQRERIAPEVRAIFHRTVAQIRSVLRPEQTKQFDEMTARVVERWRAANAGHPSATPLVSPTP